MKKNIYAFICVALSIIALLIKLLFNYYGTWEVVPKSYKKVFNIFCAGVSTSWAIIAIILFILSFIEKRRENRRQHIKVTSARI